ncbi:class I adenylate-forming enzyme family protein [Actinomadura mexicana]|uniref:Acyl-CoA synthetase (AMP-forming)/AMP-acid ligase II n=1 Tax=Actinomadura mexicana TaxID=134959 RepID=A0A239ALP1_9ACTN|nr:AMP-binding protein [Actinomadura mexicana]SNR96596.1 Acyl-CoA synthetase (AMP-forming)/AMP-acid ligase II [Actinomadura mexicana]
MNATRAALLAAGSRVLISDDAGCKRTGGELAGRVDRLAGALAERGLRGGRIGLWHTNAIAAVEASLAVEWLGATRVPVDPGAVPAEAASIWKAAGTDAVLVDREHAGADALVHDDDEPLTGPPVPPEPEVPSDRTLLLYPRAVRSGELMAVPISYGNWEATMAANIALYRGGGYGPGFGPDECFLGVQQLMHGTGLVGTFPFLRMGLPQVIMRRFDADAVLDLLRSGTVTSTMMVTGMVSRLAAAVRRRPGGLGSLRRLLYGGAPMEPADLRDTALMFGDVLVQIYGRLEGGWPLTVLDQADHRAVAEGDMSRAGSCGRPVAAAGELQIGPSGEIRVRSPMVVAEYADADGWCSLGDVGRLENGYLHLRGRLDRMINTGYHVYPQEIEDAIRRVPGVADVLVSGEPDEQHGEAVVAHLVARGDVSPRSLVAHVEAELRPRFARYKLPRRYMVTGTLPKE